MDTGPPNAALFPLAERRWEAVPGDSIRAGMVLICEDRRGKGNDRKHEH